MPKAKKSGRKKKYNYEQDRKKLKKKLLKKYNPRIENPQIRNAWDNRKSMARNLQDMGLAFDPNRSLPLKKASFFSGEREAKPSGSIVIKPYVLNQLEQEASLPEKDSKTLSSDLIEYVQHMIREHGDNYKAMARDEKNYYQDTPKQIRRKVGEYRRCHPEQFNTFVESLGLSRPMDL
ncbi:nucleolar protein 16 [Takifugu flavidus]|uniref:Nucleolar protein 16 n=2 Tax=Takifugu TaxID=31032 RepID=A0A5C6PAI1_9TELE|nr:nucleolar protein 16 [Takifugu flavidus]TNM84410.1 hypothetical protein fugu_008588 [Takifugu bimaculatus]TWW75270.1 Nucleolar protein 16 [Takifugu flavidus]